jgi:hypothetical protein
VGGWGDSEIWPRGGPPWTYLRQGVGKRSGRAGNVNDGGLNKIYNRFAQCCTKKSTKNTIINTYPELVEITGIPNMKKVTEFREILRNFTELYDKEFGGIPPEF